MNKKHTITQTFALLACLVAGSLLYGQCPDPQSPSQSDCDNGKGISTNPDSPVNEECEDMENGFDWKLQSTSSNPEYYIIQKSSTETQEVWSPFKGPFDASYYGWVTGGLGHLANNYYPEDGWELVKVQFGAMGVVYPKLPHMILYNRYNGTLRFFGALMEPDETYNTVKITLFIPKEKIVNQNNVYQDELNATNLLSIQGNSVQPLDQETDETEMDVYVPYTNNPMVFFWFDVPMAYDPCVCIYQSQLHMKFEFVQTANVTLEGLFTGEMKTKTNPNTQQPYGDLVFNRILGAMGATVTAFATQGAIVNAKSYVDLLDIFRLHPNTSAEDKDDLTNFKNLLSCAHTYYDVLKNNYANANSTDSAKRFAALNKVIEGSTTYFTSLVNGCTTNGDNAGSLINGKFEVKGQSVTSDVIQDTEISLALPGSNWEGDQLGETEYTQNGKLVPAYPTYHERLGTIALLETPEVFLYDSIAYNPDNPVLLSKPVFLRFGLKEDLKYTFNPKMNINYDKTEIYCRYVISEELSLDFIGNQSPFINLNIANSDGQYYRYHSPFVPIDQFKSLPVVGLFNEMFFVDPLHPLRNGNLDGKVFIQFKVFFESNDVGTNNKANQSYLFLTFPVSLHKQSVSAWLPPGQPTVITQHGEINMFQTSKSFDTDVIFSESQILAFDGFVDISAKISSIGGHQVEIYATQGIELRTGAEIGPNVELHIGYPFPQILQLPASPQSISIFCTNSNKYKAKDFTAASVQRMQEEERDRHIQEAMPEDSLEPTYIPYKLQPNPNSGIFDVTFNRVLSTSATLTITDLTGRVLHTQTLVEGQRSFNIHNHNLESGIYLVTITQYNERKTQKMVIQAD